MSVTLETPADARDRRALVEVLARAFLDNPMNRRLHGPRPERRLRANRAGLRALVLDLHRWTEARVIRNEGRIVGGFVAVPPEQVPLPAASLRRQLGCLVWQGARAMEGWSRVTEALRREPPPAAHWYLATLGVDPRWQGRGFGRALVESLVALAAPSGLAIQLECDRPESVDFYRARGFERWGCVRVFDLPCWRLARASGVNSSGEGSDLCNSVAHRSAPESLPPAFAAPGPVRSEAAK